MEGAMTLDEWAKAGKGETWRVATGELHNLIDEALDRLDARDEELRQSRAEVERLKARFEKAAEMDWFLSEPPTAGEVEYAALIRVAAAATAYVNRVSPETWHDLTDALAELRRARSEAHVDEVRRSREEWDRGGSDG